MAIEHSPPAPPVLRVSGSLAARPRWTTLAAMLLAVVAPCADRSAAQTKGAERAPYVATPDPLVDAMLELAETGPGDHVIDLGSGDGRIVIRAVTRYRARSGVGIDIDANLVRIANENARAAGVADRVQFVEGDLFAQGVGAATVVTIYLLPSMMGRVEQKLRAELRPGTRIVVHDYPFPNWRPERIVESDSPEKIRATGQTTARLYLYRVPAGAR